MKTKLFITAAALMVLTALASAQDKAANQNQQNATKQRCCSMLMQTMTVSAIILKPADQEIAKEIGQGIMRGAGQGQGKRMGMGPCGMGPCGMGHSRGNGVNYVDANNNGICDFRETPAKK